VTGEMWFDGWSNLARVVILGALAYALMLTVLRVAGKRTLAKLNAFDLWSRWRWGPCSPRSHCPETSRCPKGISPDRVGVAPLLFGPLPV
jgi:hypothetical protein